MQTAHRAFEPSSKSAFAPPAASTDLSHTERRFEVLINGVTHISNQVWALSLEQALIEIRKDTAAPLVLTVALADIEKTTRPFANLRFLYRIHYSVVVYC